MWILTERWLELHPSLPQWDSPLCGCTSAGGLPGSTTGKNIQTHRHTHTHLWGHTDALICHMSEKHSFLTHLLQFAMDHKSGQAAEGEGRAATSVHLPILQPVNVLRHQNIYVGAKDDKNIGFKFRQEGWQLIFISPCICASAWPGSAW